MTPSASALQRPLIGFFAPSLLAGKGAPFLIHWASWVPRVSKPMGANGDAQGPLVAARGKVEEEVWDTELSLWPQYNSPP